MSRLPGLRSDRAVVMCGDFFGALLAWAVVHALWDRHGFLPGHLLVSGCADPRTASAHWGLGSTATGSIADVADDEIAAWLNDRSGTGVRFDARDDAVDLRAMQADCLAYERFAQDDALPRLPIGATVARGERDAKVCAEEMVLWGREFEDPAALVLPDAGHDIYASSAPALADHPCNVLPSVKEAPATRGSE